MQNVHAFVVGIDQYAQHDWSLPGPCANALAVTEWLLAVNTPPQNIVLFAEPFDASHEAQLERLEQLGVRISRSADYAAIDTHWRMELQKARPAGSRLFIYWSGHGFADHDGDRVFICRDYTHPQLKNRVLNSTKMLRQLHGAAYQHFSEQLFIADVCAVKANVDISADKHADAVRAPGTKQLIFYATPEGEYAKGDDGRGVFTRITLEVLQQVKSWPSLPDFNDAMLVFFKKVDQSIFRVYREDATGPTETSVGKLPAARAHTLFESVFNLLSQIDLPDSTYRPHYLRTVSDLGEPELASAQGLTGMLTELASLGDGAAGQRVPYGLLQFLQRLREAKGLQAAIDEWLDEHAALQKNERATLAEKLSEEARTKILVVEVDNDEKEEISGYDLSVRTNSLLPVPDCSYPHRTVKDWDDFRTHLLADIDDLKHRHGIEDVEIQFLVNPPLFDRCFHSIAPASGSRLGDEHVVLVRHRDRVRSPTKTVRESWTRYSDALRALKPCEIKLLPIAMHSGATGVLPEEKGLCYTNFLLEPAGRTPNSLAKQTLMRLLRGGVPYVYWLHTLPSQDALGQIEKQFGGWLKGAGSIDQLPTLFTAQRGQGNSFACDATLLWDDPQFNPFSTTKS
jgi:hypothetical protein